MEMRHQKTSFLQHLLSVAMKYRTNAMKIGLSTDESDDSWGVNVWSDKINRVQYSPSSKFDGPELNDDFISIENLKNVLKDRGVTSFNKTTKYKKTDNRKYTRGRE